MGVDHAMPLSRLLSPWMALPAGPDPMLTGLSLDSRQLQPGDVFLACRGGTRHGLAHLEQALASRPAAVLWEPAPQVRPPRLDIPVVALEGLGQRASFLADRFYGEPSRRLRVVGITGTDGKTSCAHLLGQALEACGQRCGVIGTLGYGLLGELRSGEHTTPDAVSVQRLLAEYLRAGADAAVMEVSSHALDQGRAAAVRFHTAVLTNLTRDHLDYHGTLAAYAAAKRRLFEMPGLVAAVLNAEDGFGRELLGRSAFGARRIAYGLESPAAVSPEWLRAADVTPQHAGLRLRLQSSWGGGELSSGLLGRFNALNLLAACGVLLAGGLGLDQALQALAGVRPVPGRMELHGGRGRPSVVVDYAHTPNALEQVLAALREHCAGRLLCVFGCGGDRDRGKRAEMAEVVGRRADAAIVTDDNPRSEDPDRIVADILAGLPDATAYRVERDRARAIRLAVSEAAPNDWVLVAGKGHEDYQLVGDRRLSFSDAREVELALEAVA